MLCDYCGSKIPDEKLKEKRYHANRRNSKVMGCFCSHHCYQKYRMWNSGNTIGHILLEQLKHSAKIRGRSISKYITKEYIESLFANQRNRCALSGLYLYNCFTDKQFLNLPYHHRPSIDRIDSGLDYEIGNIQIVCLTANWAKNKMSNSQALEFFELIRNTNVNY